VSDTFDPSAAGEGAFTISYQYTDGNGCSDSVIETITVESCLSVEEGTQGLFAIYPNPAYKKVTVHRFNSDAEMELIVFDTNGKKILHQKIKENPVDIDVSSWANGSYNFPHQKR
jgi:hypothetical protein